MRSLSPLPRVRAPCTSAHLPPARLLRQHIRALCLTNGMRVLCCASGRMCHLALTAMSQRPAPYALMHHCCVLHTGPWQRPQSSPGHMHKCKHTQHDTACTQTQHYRLNVLTAASCSASSSNRVRGPALLFPRRWRMLVVARHIQSCGLLLRACTEVCALWMDLAIKQSRYGRHCPCRQAARVHLCLCRSTV